MYRYVYTRFRSLKYYTYHVHFIFVVKNAIIPHRVTNEKMIKKKSYGLKMQHSEVWVNLIKTGGNPPQKTLKNKGLLVFKNIPVSYTCHFHLGKW